MVEIPPTPVPNATPARSGSMAEKSMPDMAMAWATAAIPNWAERSSRLASRGSMWAPASQSFT
jgi:hypothetical protein